MAEKVSKKSKSKSRKTSVANSSKNDFDDDKSLKIKASDSTSRRKKMFIMIVALFITMFLFYYKSKPDSHAVVAKPITEEKKDDEKQQTKKKKKVKKGEEDDDDDDDDEDMKLLNVELIEAEHGNLGWRPTQGALVHKRPPRECAVKRIMPQVTSPFFIASKKDNWHRRIYSCVLLNKEPCQVSIMNDFEARRWKLKGNKVALEKRAQSTFIITNLNTLTKLSEAKPDVFNDIYRKQEGSTYLNTILGSSALGGTIMEQFSSRSAFTSSFGCRYNSLKVQMPLYRYDVFSECQRMEKTMSKDPSYKWILMAPEGESVSTSSTLMSNKLCSTHAKYADPRKSQYLASLAMGTPFKIEGKLFDVRSFMLIGSTMPMMVFFQRGYVRRAAGSVANSFNMFDSGSSDITLEEFQDYLATGKITGSHYVDTFLQSSMKQIAIFVFHAARPKLQRRKGSYQLFSLDFVIDSTFRVYLEKTNGDPPIKNSLKMDVNTMVADMHDLVQELHEVPVAFETMVKGDKYGSWELVFSELRETCDKIVYNPCHKFIDFNQKDLVKSNKKVGKVQATQKRLDNEKKRIIKKTEEKKKTECRENKIPYPSSKCDKYMDGLAQVKFEQLFKEHEASHNPNEFRLPKPGEVFPHEIV